MPHKAPPLLLPFSASTNYIPLMPAQGNLGRLDLSSVLVTQIKSSWGGGGIAPEGPGCGA